VYITHAIDVESYLFVKFDDIVVSEIAGVLTTCCDLLEDPDMMCLILQVPIMVPVEDFHSHQPSQAKEGISDGGDHQTRIDGAYLSGFSLVEHSQVGDDLPRSPAATIAMYPASRRLCVTTAGSE
jgi:hypothetical protein